MEQFAKDLNDLIEASVGESRADIAKALEEKAAELREEEAADEDEADEADATAEAEELTDGPPESVASAAPSSQD
jgi:hypothetical protein